MDRLLLKPSEVADVTGLGRSKVYALLAQNKLPKVIVGKSVRVPAAALKRWIDENTVGKATGDQRSDAIRSAHGTTE